MTNRERVQTTEQLRIAIDRGQAGDKVDFPDPAAAPLGTDDEAGGHRNTPAQVRLAAERELSRPPQKRQASAGLGHAWWLVGFTVVTGVAIVAGFLILQTAIG